MAKLSRLEDNFERDYRDAFEDMATHMLVAEFGLPRTPLRRKNQALIEGDPVMRNDGRCFAYQVKYLDATTEAKVLEEPFKGAVREAREGCHGPRVLHQQAADSSSYSPAASHSCQL